MPISAAQTSALSYVETIRADLSDWTARIFSFGETAWREYESAAWYVDLLRKQGFSVEEGSAGMPTAFSAEWSNGPGPVIGMYAEYDAVPGNCQAATTRREPRENLSFEAGGHTDPHSALGIGALGGLLATKAAMQRHDIKGTLRFTGEPAEKVRGSKPIHAAKGYYDGLDGMFSFHPFYMLPMCNTVRWDTHCGAAYSMIYRFVCDQPEAWGRSDDAPIPQSHSAVRAPGANDALMTMYMASKALRDSMLTHQGGWSISEAILTAGQATADNLPASLAEIQYMIRVPTIAMAEQVASVLDRNAGAAAAMTGCRYERHWVSKSRPGLANHAMADLVWDALQSVGPPRWDEAARTAAREIQANLGVETMENPFIDEMEKLISPAGRRSHPAARSRPVAAEFHLGRLYRHELARADCPLLHRPSGAQGTGGLHLSRLGLQCARRHTGHHRSDRALRRQDDCGLCHPAFARRYSSQSRQNRV